MTSPFLSDDLPRLILPKSPQERVRSLLLTIAAQALCALFVSLFIWQMICHPF